MLVYALLLHTCLKSPIGLPGQDSFAMTCAWNDSFFGLYQDKDKCQAQGRDLAKMAESNTDIAGDKRVIDKFQCSEQPVE